MLPKKLQQKLKEREVNNSLRILGDENSLIDFSSNDYLGFSASTTIKKRTSEILENFNQIQNGSGGSRLLTGNHPLYNEAEGIIAQFHGAEDALIYNSGYDANIGLISSVAQRRDLIFYDELVHASIRDGIKMSNAKSFKFAHNDISQLKELITRNNTEDATIYVVTESVFSMDGDSPDLKELAEYCFNSQYFLIVDEAHAVGVLAKGNGVVCRLGIENKVFATIVTFGKACGTHGAAILCGTAVKEYLINFSRSLIYTTALPPHSVANIIAAYEQLLSEAGKQELNKLNLNIALLRSKIKEYGIESRFIESESAIHCCLIPGNSAVKTAAEMLRQQGFDLRPILAPTVPLGQERLRICLHAYNSEKEIKKMVSLISKFLSN